MNDVIEEMNFVLKKWSANWRKISGLRSLWPQVRPPLRSGLNFNAMHCIAIVVKIGIAMTILTIIDTHGKNLNN